jgi:hypothetical protein
MSLVVTTLATLAVLATAVIFGTDVLTALVLRPAYADLDDRSLTTFVGRTHFFGGRRLSIPGAGSVVAAALTVLAALLSDRTGTAIAAGAGLLLLLAWLVIFNRISLPINKVFIAAGENGADLPEARDLQARWDSVINLRAVLQGAALIAFCAALALA